MYFKDLHREESHFGVVKIKIGWLDEGQPYMMGVAPAEFVEKMKKIPLSVHTKGWHNCPFCGKSKSYSQYLINIGDKTYYDVPEMIVHYIEKHDYLPPQEFIDTIMRYKLPEPEVRIRKFKDNYK
jgi:hypothetical protein